MTAPSPERSRLAASLRELKDRTGLSLVGLAAKTAYSKSSWDRYLNGRTLPPRDAVRKLCRLAGEPEGRCLALWEIAEAQESGRGEPTRRAEGGARPPGATPAPPPAPSAASLDSPSVPSAQSQGSPPAPSPPSQDSPRPRTPSPDSAPPPASSSDSPRSPAPCPDSPPPLYEVTPSSGSAGGAPGAVHRSAAATAVLASACAVVVGGLVAAALLLPGGNGEPRSSAPPSPAAAGPRCLGAVCEGKNPMHMRCGAEPTTVATHRTATGAWMELRYSEACGASWARMWGTRVGDRIEMTAGGRAGPVRSAEVEDAVDADTYVYTPMTAAPPGTVARACFRPAAGGEPECFDGRVNPA
ncbi:DUF2690 domain-containing protein [Streptomyces sp. NPDC051243]|uniref:helix-turn-helix domain-containing protein n=1 Tax=Streptomyces sp. NPDC051243 TaxID=3365646 RepID=UPI0037B6C9C1